MYTLLANSNENLNCAQFVPEQNYVQVAKNEVFDNKCVFIDIL